MKQKNKINKILTLTFLFFFLFLLTGFVSADPQTEPCWVKGEVIGEDIDVEGLTVGAYLGSSLLKSGTIDENGLYSLNAVGANDEDTISLKVLGATFETFTFEGYCKTNGDPWIVVDFNVSKQENGISCTSNNICLSGNCSNNVCSVVSTGGTTGGDPSGSTTGTTGDDTTGDDDETTTETYSSTTTTPSSTDLEEMLVGSNLSEEELEEYLQAADDGHLEVERTLVVQKTTSSGQDTYTSTFNITIRNTSNNLLEEIKIVETIPKEIAESASEISSVYEFRILIDDPVIEFIIPSLSPGESIDVPYYIDKQVTEEEFLEMKGIITKSNVAFSEPEPEDGTTTPDDPYIPDTDTTQQIEDTPTPKSNAWLWIVLIMIVLGVVVIYILKNNKNKPKGLKKYK